MHASCHHLDHILITVLITVLIIALAICRRMANPLRAALLGIPAGAGLMVGDGLWQLPVRFLLLASCFMLPDA